MSTLWKPVETQFFGQRVPVGLVTLPNRPDAYTMRSMLEDMNAVVHMYGPGTPEDFLKVLRIEKDVPTMMWICGHGLSGGIVMGEYASFIDTSMLRNGNLPPEQIAANVRLPGCTIIGDFCDSGAPAMAEAFLKGGAKAYIGIDPASDMNWLVGNVFLSLFMYHLRRHNLSIKEAWAKTAGYDDWTRGYVYYDQEGRHQVS